MLSVKALITAEADDILKFNLFIFFREIREISTHFLKEKLVENVDIFASILHDLCDLYKSIQKPVFLFQRASKDLGYCTPNEYLRHEF